MKRKNYLTLTAIIFTLVFISTGIANAQIYSATSGGYRTGYGTVYGSFGLAMATQNIYNTTQMAIQKAQTRALMIKKFGLAAVEKAERESAAKSAKPSNPQIVVSPPPVVRNHGLFRP